MEESTFKHEMAKARTFQGLGERSDYWAGYQRGLRRHYHGDKFGTEGEHRLWLDCINSEDEQRHDRGRGYHAGFYFREYCTQNDNDCSTCSLVNYGRDCQNNPIDAE